MTERSRRRGGTGAVDEFPKGSGKWRVRVTVQGKRFTVASGLSRAAADDTANAYLHMSQEAKLTRGLTLAEWGEGFLDRREKRGLRAVEEDRNRWRTYVENDEIGQIAMGSLRRADVIQWRDRLLQGLSMRGRHGLSRQTVKNALNLLRQALAEALDRELIPANPAFDVRLPRSTQTTQQLDLEGILLPHEQTALLAAVPSQHRPLVLFALSMGVRWSEASWLAWEDVTDDKVVIRRSRGGLATKSGKPRKLPLTPPARFALAEARRLVPDECPWVFPGPAIGEPRKHRPSAWDSWVEAAGIKKRVRFHDLRHTTATSLIAGWWGEKWSLEEVRRQLGHSTIQITERYARLVDDMLDEAAARTSFDLFGSLRADPKAGPPPGPVANDRGGDLGPKNVQHSNDFVNRRSGVQIPKLAPCNSAELEISRVAKVDLPLPSRNPLFARQICKEPRHVQPLREAYHAAVAGDEDTCVDALARATATLTGSKRGG